MASCRRCPNTLKIQEDVETVAILSFWKVIKKVRKRKSTDDLEELKLLPNQVNAAYGLVASITRTVDQDITSATDMLIEQIQRQIESIQKSSVGRMASAHRDSQTHDDRSTMPSNLTPLRRTTSLINKIPSHTSHVIRSLPFQFTREWMLNMPLKKSSHTGNNCNSHKSSSTGSHHTVRNLDVLRERLENIQLMQAERDFERKQRAEERQKIETQFEISRQELQKQKDELQREIKNIRTNSRKSASTCTQNYMPDTQPKETHGLPDNISMNAPLLPTPLDTESNRKLILEEVDSDLETTTEPAATLSTSYSRPEMPVDVTQIPIQGASTQSLHLQSIHDKPHKLQNGKIGLLVGCNCSSAITESNCTSTTSQTLKTVEHRDLQENTDTTELSNKLDLSGDVLYTVCVNLTCRPTNAEYKTDETPAFVDFTGDTSYVDNTFISNHEVVRKTVPDSELAKKKITQDLSFEKKHNNVDRAIHIQKSTDTDQTKLVLPQTLPTRNGLSSTVTAIQFDTIQIRIDVGIISPFIKKGFYWKDQYIN